MKQLGDESFPSRTRLLQYVQQKVVLHCWKASLLMPMKETGGKRLKVEGKKWEWETGRRVEEKKKKGKDRQEMWEEMHPPRHSWARCHVGLSHGIWLEILVLCLLQTENRPHPVQHSHCMALVHSATKYTKYRHDYTASNRIIQRRDLQQKHHLLRCLLLHIDNEYGAVCLCL